MSSPPTLPILSLPNPHILFPHARLTIPVPQESAALLKHDDLLVGVVPTTAEGNLAEWGVAASVVSLVKQKSRHLVTLQGIHRIRLLTELTTSQHLPVYQVSHHDTPTDPPSKDSISDFKSTALRFLAVDASSHPSKRRPYLKFLTLLSDGTVTDNKIPIIADLLVASIDADFNDKLEILSTTPSTVHLSLATSLLQKQTSISQVSQKVSSTVAESLSNQQKEFFLRQQLAAIQRELVALKQANPTAPPGSTSPPISIDLDADIDADFSSETEDTSLASIKRSILLMCPNSEERIAGIREWKRLKRIPNGSVESGVVRTYLEWLTSLPWPSSQTSPSPPLPLPNQTQPNLQSFLTASLAQLNADHYGLHEVKKRIIEYLAVVKLREMRSTKAKQQTTTKGPILLFLGPPGTGKTSLGLSISRSLGLPFHRISLGGVRDEAEIRGHRRTYVAAGPGRVVKALCGMWRDVREGRVNEQGNGKETEWKGGVLLLDEIDKIAQSNYHGDPSAALLEVLDPEQNHSFTDHYISLPISLSPLLFICTANSLSPLPPALLDRCEIIHLPGYTPSEKVQIATKFLLPKLLRENFGTTGGEGEQEAKVVLRKEAIVGLVDQYAWSGAGDGPSDGAGGEGGVRGLEKALGRVVRGKVVEFAKSLGTTASSGPQAQGYNPVVELGDLEKYLGLPRYRWEEAVGLDFDENGDGDDRDLGVEITGLIKPKGKTKTKGQRGVVCGLVVSGIGEGGVLPVESVFVPAGTGGGGGVRLTGMLGDVLKESAELALTWVKAHAYDLCITARRGEDPFKVPFSVSQLDPTGSRYGGVGSGPGPEQERGRGQGGVDVHIHLPSGAQKKDGPSAGIAMVCALISLLTGHTVPPTTALTGEITLRGAVAPVGGIKAKLLGAQRVGLKKVILPWGNRREVEGVFASDSESDSPHDLAGEANKAREDVGVEMKKDLKCVFVRSVREAVDEAFGRGILVWRGESERHGVDDSNGKGVGTGMGMGKGEEGHPIRVSVLDESRL